MFNSSADEFTFDESSIGEESNSEKDKSASSSSLSFLERKRPWRYEESERSCSSSSVLSDHSWVPIKQLKENKIVVHRSNDLRPLLNAFHKRAEDEDDVQAKNDWCKSRASPEEYFLALDKRLFSAEVRLTDISKGQIDMNFNKVPIHEQQKKTAIQRSVKMPGLTKEDMHLFNSLLKNVPVLPPFSSTSVGNISRRLLMEYRVKYLATPKVNVVDLNSEMDFEWFSYTFGTDEDKFSPSMNPVVAQLRNKMLTIQIDILSKPDIALFFKKLKKPNAEELEAREEKRERSKEIYLEEMNYRNNMINKQSTRLRDLVQQNIEGAKALKTALTSVDPFQYHYHQAQELKEEVINETTAKLKGYISKSIDVAVKNKIINKNALAFLKVILEDPNGIGRLRPEHYEGLDWSSIKFLFRCGLLHRTNETKEGFSLSKLS